MSDVETLFSPDSIQGVVDSIAEDDERNYQALDLFMNSGSELEVDNDTVKWDKRLHTRSMPPAGDPDAPSIQYSTGGAAVEHTPIAWFALHKVIPLRRILHRERDLGSLRPNAQGQLRRAVRDLYLAMKRAANFFCARVLTPNGVEVNQTNFPGSQVTYDYAYPLIGTNAIAAADSMSNPAYNWLSSTQAGSLHAIQEAFAERTGHQLETAIARRKFYTLVKGNTQLREWLRGNPIALQLLLQGKTQDALSDMGGIMEWWRWDDFFQIEGGGAVNPTKTASYFLPEEDDMVLLPGRSALPDVLGWAEAMVDVPDGAIGFEESGVASMGGERPGLTIYAIWGAEPDPPRLKIIARWGFCPIVLNANAVQYVTGIASGVGS